MSIGEIRNDFLEKDMGKNVRRKNKIFQIIYLNLNELN